MPAPSALNHANILTTCEIGAEGGTDYIATKQIAGPTLAERLAPGPLPSGRALRLAAQVADALPQAGACYGRAIAKDPSFARAFDARSPRSATSPRSPSPWVPSAARIGTLRSSG